MHIYNSLCRDRLRQNTQTQTTWNFKWQFNMKMNFYPSSTLVSFASSQTSDRPTCEVQLGCLHLHQWPVTYLMAPFDWTMSCQPGTPRAHHGQWTRWQQRPVSYTSPYKMANFHSVYLKLSRIDPSEFVIWYSEKWLSYCHKISKWYDEPVLCYRRVKICNFTMSKEGPSDYFHLHARAPPTAVPGCVDKRIQLSNQDRLHS